MSISTKTTLLILLMAILLSLSAYLIQRNLIFPAFTNIELNQARDNIDRVIRRLRGELSTVDFTVYDWSSWDDTYRFMGDQNEAFVASNLNADTFWNYGFEVALIMDMEGSSAWAGIYDFQAEEASMDQTDQHLASLLSSAKKVSQQIDLQAEVDNQKVSGVIELNKTLVLFSMRPIHKSDGTGEPRGFVLFGQKLNEHTVEELSEQIVLDFSVSPINSQISSANLPDYSIETLSPERLKVSKVLEINRKPSLTASVTLPREVTQLGREITLYGITVFILLSLTMSTTLLLLFRLLVIKPILDLKEDISKISSDMDYSMRAQIRNEDEIGALSKEFNVMLSIIESNNNKLKKMTETDPLTGLFNRLALDRKLKQAWDILSRTGSPLAVMLIDVDHFKSFNDHYGHPAGDECLQRIANILKNAAKRDADMVARYGGEEFAVVLLGTAKEDALEIAAQLQRTVAAAGIEHKASGAEPFVTVSIGVSTLVPSQNFTIAALLNAADRALYKAKENGRNRVESETQDYSRP